MTPEDVAARLVSALSQKLDLPAEDLSFDRSLRDDLGLDSMSLLEVVMDLEEKFGIEINQREAERFKTIGDLARFLQANAAD